MKKLTFLVLLSTISLSLSAQLTNTRLWRISGNGLTRPSYLYGSMHVDDERAFNFSDSLFYALSSCDLFANEVAFDSLIKFLYKNIDNKFQQKLEDAYFDNDALDELSQTTGLDKVTLKKISPVVLKQLLPGTSGSKNRKPAVLDNYLYNIAKHEGKICTGIEDMNLQISLFNQFPEYLKKDYTDYTIGKKRNAKSNEMLEIYHNADLNAVDKIMKTLPQEVYKAMITDRNLGMANRIDSISRYRSSFYTIGFGHLPGKEGLINLLKNKGFKVDPVVETFTGMAEKFPFSNQTIPWITFSDPKSGFAIDMPGQWYTSPNFPLGLAHAMYLDLGTNSFYMTAARSSSLFGSVTDIDSLTYSFVFNAWKINAPKDKIHKVFLDGMEFRQIDKLKISGFYLSLRIAKELDNLFVMVGMNNQEKEMGDINRFFNSFRKIKKNAENWNTFISPKGGYEVTFPGKPVERTISNKSGQSSGTLVGIIDGTDNTTGNEYYLQYIDNEKNYYPDDTLALGTIQKSIASTFKYSNLKSDFVSVEGFPALRFSCEIDNGQTYRMLAVVRGTRIYNLISAESTSRKDTSQSIMFFNSFKFKNYTYSNWTQHVSDEGYFATVSPSLFQQKIEEPDKSIFTSSESYYSFDELTGDKLFVTRKVYSPYYSAICDSSFFMNLFTESVSKNDSIISMVKSKEDSLTYIFTSLSPQNHLFTKSKIIIKGRSLYTVIAMYPRLSEGTHPAVHSIELFNAFDTTTQGKLAENKTNKLLLDLSSNDTIISYPARDALSFYKFSKDEIPLVWQTLRHPFNDDTLKYNSTRVLLINSVGTSMDSVYKEKLIASFDTICTTNPAKLEALAWLITGYDQHYRDFVKKQLLLIPANIIYKYKVTGLLYDSAEYTLGMYPEILDILKDSLNRDDIINITADLLNTNQLQISVLKPYKDEIVLLIKSLLAEPAQLYEYDYLTPKIFLIAGYFNDPQINALLEENRDLNNKYIAYNILKVLINNNLKIKQKNIDRIAVDLDLRRSLFDFLAVKGMISRMPEKYRSQQAIAESDFYQYLVSEDYLPENMKLLGSKTLLYEGSLQRFYLYSFESNYGEEKEFIVSVAGPYPADNSISEYNNTMFGVYWSYDENKTTEQHFDELNKLIIQNTSEQGEKN